MPSYLHLCCTTFYHLLFLLLISPLFDDFIVSASNYLFGSVYLSIMPSIQLFHLSLFHFFSVSLSSSFFLSLTRSLPISVSVLVQMVDFLLQDGVCDILLSIITQLGTGQPRPCPSAAKSDALKLSYRCICTSFFIYITIYSLLLPTA